MMVAILSITTALSFNLSYCRRPREPVNLTRDNDTLSCEQNDGQLHRFSELRSKNISVSLVLHQWRSSLERVEQYSRYLENSSETDGYACECSQTGSFGKNCEYRLPVGETFEETLQWQLDMRKENPQKVQMYGDVICYETLECDSGLLCLDWREICDGIQNCMEGKDEENCDLLEMNRCDPEDEYRCMNGMCIQQEFFVDGEFDCLDWSDETPLKNDRSCSIESVSSECDDHVCPPDHWSCGDGQCIFDRLAFQKSTSTSTCVSQRDQYFMCETRATVRQWTMPNGRCVSSRQYQEERQTNENEDELCSYLLKCSLSLGGEKGCSCYQDPQCAKQLEERCLLSSIQYPRGALMGPFMFLQFNRRRNWRNFVPDSILLNGTVRCRDVLINVTKMIPFNTSLNVRQITEDHFCRPSRNISSLLNSESRRECHDANESLDRCGEWNRCLSITRIRDGFKNCLNGRDEVRATEMEIDKSCSRVRRHRFRCSREQPSCLSVMKLGDPDSDCSNKFDESWFGGGRRMSDINCNAQRKEECSRLRQYLEESWTAKFVEKIETRSEHGIRFRSYCDSFWDLVTREDEDLRQCRRWWICRADQFRCQSGQCVSREWIGDGKCDCADGSEEHNRWTGLALWRMNRSSLHDFTNRSYFVPSSCPSQSSPFLCLSSKGTRVGLSCFNLSQFGDGHVDCAGALDERNILEHCSKSSSMLGNHFLCRSANTCIPFLLHCFDNNRCPNRSDDELRCSRQDQSSGRFGLSDFVCFDGQYVEGGRCNQIRDCCFAEDEYACDHPGSSQWNILAYRQTKTTTRKQHLLRLSRYPIDANLTTMDSRSISSVSPRPSLTLNPSSSSSFSPYWCNRGVALLLNNHSTIVCFCPPQYYGDKCQFHADRVSVVLRLDVSQSMDSSRNGSLSVVKLLVDFVFIEEVLERREFHVAPSSADILSLKKLRTHFVFPRSSSSREERRRRFFNRSSLLHRHSYSIRIQLHRSHLDEQPSLIRVWNSPLSFSHLPVSRFARVLHWNGSSRDQNEQLTTRNRSTRLSRSNIDFLEEKEEEEEDPRCANSYCAVGSRCQSKSRSLFRGDSLPLCLCPMNRFGERCFMKHSVCLVAPCLNDGSCVPDTQPNQMICVCTEGYLGSRCQWARPSIHLSIPNNVPSRAAVLQFFQIDSISLDPHLVDQQVFQTLPQHIQFDPQDQRTIPEIIAVKLYSSDDNSSPDLYLLSMQNNVISLRGTTQISSNNRCEHRRTFFNESSPIEYHQICIRDHDRLCFRDDVFLCICDENHTRVECFNYDDQLDQCEFCLSNGRCLRGNPRLANHFLCLCPECHSGEECQFNTRSFSFTVDQLFSPDLISNRKQTTICLLIFFSLVTFFLALPNNLFSFFTLRRRSCLRQGVGHYLLVMSVTNQLSLALLAARLIHLTVIITTRRSSPLVNHLFCKLVTYLLTCFTGLTPWLSSFIALERVYSVVFFNRHWLKQAHIARSLMLWTGGLILLSAAYEIAFVKSFTSIPMYFLQQAKTRFYRGSAAAETP